MLLQFFDRQAEYRVVERRLPHWSQAGVVCFLTWRTADSMPRSVLAAWLAERDDWLRAQNIDPADERWRSQLANLPQGQQRRFHETLGNR